MKLDMCKTNTRKGKDENTRFFEHIHEKHNEEKSKWMMSQKDGRESTGILYKSTNTTIIYDVPGRRKAG